MSCIYPIRKRLLQNVITLLFLSLSFANNIKASVDSDVNHQVIDSLKTLVSECNIDTCRFNILSNYFWTVATNNMDSVKFIGEWAYQEIKQSKSIRHLSDGLDIKGCLLEKEKKYDSAYILFQKSLVLAKSISYNPRISWSYYHLGLINENIGKNDSALFYYKTLVDFNLKAGYKGPAFDMLLTIAFFYYNLNLYDSSESYFLKALSLSKEMNDNDREIQIRLKLSGFYDQINQIKKELEQLNEVLLIANQSKNQKAISSVYYSIGDIFFYQKKNYDLALSYYQKAYSNIPADKEDMEAAVLNDITRVYIAMNKDSLALKYSLKTLSIAEKINFKHQISEAHKNLGTIYDHQGELEKAIYNYNYCYDLGCDKCSKINFHSALIKMGDAYLKLNKPREALETYKKSLKLAQDFKANNELAVSNLKIGNYYSSSNIYLAERYYNEAKAAALKGTDISNLKDIADTLSSLYLSSRDYRSAFENQCLARKMADSLNTIKQQESMANWETRFEFEKLAQENDSREKISQEEIKQQKIYRNSAWLISLLLLVLGYVIWNSYKRKKTDYRLLEDQKKQIEEQNQEILAQIEEISSQKEEIERISQELHHIDEMKLRYFSNISHEFRTPLTLIINPVKKLLESTSANGELKKQLEHVYLNARKLHDLTNQIMDLQKLDAGSLTLNPEKDDLISFCTGIVSSFESLCDKRKNNIKLTADQISVTAMFDKDKIGKIIVNLLSNALKFCYENTTIEVRFGIAESKLFSLTVTDEGIGIAENQIEQIFRRYYQASPEQQTEGTGIGLAYVKELVDFMKGDVHIESRVNKGTKVSIAIPLNQVEITDQEPVVIYIPESPEKRQVKEFNVTDYMNDNEKSILIVEDNNELRLFIADLFKADYNVYLASDGKQGIQAAIKYTPDIIISDVMMPVMNGFELCNSIKNDEHTSHIPVLLLTAKDAAENSMEGYQSGADDYILKPFDNELLKLKVRNILNTKAALSKQFNPEYNTLPNAGAYSDIDKNFMKKCILAIEKNISNTNFSVDMLAFELSFSRSNLYRKIISLTTFNPAELIRNIRMQHAAKLLKTTSLRVNEVAMDVGYDSAVKFSQAFRKHHGVLPSEMV